ncbi:MAG: hypothetical protein NTU98_05220 [Bacteroidetes bacterium]|nr:hypothetical protein [Bacteroidota bacterium]
MAELDYYSVMQKRIEYFAKRYDPYNRYLPREEPVPEEAKVPKVRKSPNKAMAAFSYLYSLLF